MTVDATTPAFARPRLDVGLTFKGGWNAFTADIVALIVGALIACILSVVTIGILAGPLSAGLYSMVVGRIRDGRPARIGDVFSCMDRFWGFLWAAIVLVVLIGLASLTIIGGVLLATVWLYVFPFMVDRKMGLTDAMSASYHQVVDNGFWEHLVLLVIVFAIGAVANGWVGILTTPFTIALIAAAYFVSGGRGDLIEHPPAPPAPAAPPAATVQVAPRWPPLRQRKSLRPRSRLPRWPLRPRRGSDRGSPGPTRPDPAVRRTDGPGGGACASAGPVSRRGSLLRRVRPAVVLEHRPDGHGVPLAQPVLSLEPVDELRRRHVRVVDAGLFGRGLQLPGVLPVFAFTASR